MKVELQGITKRFPGVIANRDVNLSVNSGEVLALLGENGAGKSTLMNVLFGLYAADEGQIVLDGTPVKFSSPRDAIAAGIGMVHQHFMLVPVFTVAENLMLGNEVTGLAGALNFDAARQRIRELASAHGMDLEPDQIVEQLPVGVQQRAEILKALYRDAKCLILDEPTAVLTPSEIADLERVIRELADAGKSIIFITHKLGEVLRIADHITVLRRGEVVGTAVPSETDQQKLASMMVGHDVQLIVDKTPAKPGSVVLDVADLVVSDGRGLVAVDGVSFTVQAGEILAIAGVQGNGQTELAEALTGLTKPASGTIMIGDVDATTAGPAELVRLGVAHVPEDRQADGLIGSFSVADNIVLNSYNSAPFASRGTRNRGTVRDTAARLVEEFDIRTPSADVSVSTLSGGNQQKVIVAREFMHAQQLLVASQPTRGLDVGSIQYIHERIVAERDRGAAVVIVSAELDEVLALGDRIAVMYAGKFVGIEQRSETNRERIGLMMAGSNPDATPAATP